MKTVRKIAIALVLAVAFASVYFSKVSAASTCGQWTSQLASVWDATYGADLQGISPPELMIQLMAAAESTLVATVVAQDNLEHFLDSKCGTRSGTICGTSDWSTVIADSDPNIVTVGISNNGQDTTQPYIHVDYLCPSMNCGTNAVALVILNAQNTNGLPLGIAMQNWDLPNCGFIDVNLIPSGFKPAAYFSVTLAPGCRAKGPGFKDFRE